MTRNHFVDRHGRPLATLEWAELWENPEYRIVAHHDIGRTAVRTVWEGITTVGYLYYTAVTNDGGRNWHTVAHAGTEGGAVATHNRIVSTYRSAAEE